MEKELKSLLKKYENKLLNLKEVYMTITIDDYDRGSNISAQTTCNEIICDLNKLIPKTEEIPSNTIKPHKERISDVYDSLVSDYSDIKSNPEIRLEIKTKLQIKLGGEFVVILDETNNPPELVDMNCIVAQIRYNHKDHSGFDYVYLVFGNNTDVEILRNLYNFGSYLKYVMCIIPPQPPIDYEKAARVRELIGKNILDMVHFKPLVDELDDKIFSDGELELYCKQMDKPFDDFRRERYEIFVCNEGHYSMITVFWIHSAELELNLPTALLWKKLVGEYIENK